MTPAPAICLALFVGVCLTYGLTLPLGLALPVAVGGVAAYATLAFFFSKSSGAKTAVAAVLAALLVGLAAGAHDPWRTRPSFKQGHHLVMGELRRLTRTDDGSLKLDLAVMATARVGKDADPPPLFPTKVTARLWSRVNRDVSRLRPGDRVLVRASSLFRRGRHNFGDSTRAFAATGPVTGTVVAGPLAIPSTPWPTKLHQALVDRIARGLDEGLAQPQRGLALALSLGDRSSLEPRTAAAFRSTGAAHLLAVSGLHMSVVGGIVLWLLTRLFLLTPWAQGRRAQAGAAMAAIGACWSYACLTGLAPPVVRASIMLSAALLAVAAGRPSRATTALILAGTIMVLIDPSLVVRASFQLSFAAVLALIQMPSSPIGQKVKGSAERGRLAGLSAYALGLTASSLVATLATSPLVAHHFGQLAAMSVPVNLVAVPVTVFWVLPVSLGLALASAISPTLGATLGSLVSPGLAVLPRGLEWASTLPGAGLSVARPTLAEALALTAATVCLVRLRRTSALMGLLLAIFACASMAIRCHGPQLASRLRVTFIDVGAGDATLIDFPEGGRMLVDSGPDEGALGRVPAVVAALQRRGVGKLRIFALTHCHSDHVAGAPEVVRRIGARRLFLPACKATSALADQSHGNVVSHTAMGCQRFRAGGVWIEVLHPCGRDLVDLSENDRSLVLRLTYGKVSVLLPGDVEAAAEQILLRRPDLLEAAIVKLPHHGSRTSSSPAWLDAVGPSLAIASCSKSRRRPLPHPEVTDRLRRRGTILMSTAEVGAVEVETDGSRIWARTAKGGSVPLH